jgi:cation-transporting ATPase 13A2
MEMEYNNSDVKDEQKQPLLMSPKADTPIIIPKDAELSKIQSIGINFSPVGNGATMFPLNEQTKYEFIIAQYDEVCEDFSKIDKLECLEYDRFKIALFIFLNIITIFSISLLVIWYPKLKLYFFYSIAPLNRASLIGVYGSDNRFYVEDLEIIKLPSISKDSSLFKCCRNNIYESTVKMFQFKYYDYIYDPMMENFASVDFLLTCTLDKVYKRFSKGLTQEECEFQKKLFKKGDIDVKIEGSNVLLSKTLFHPFYVYTLFTVIFCFNNDYSIYAACLLVVTMFSVFTEVWEAREIQINIKAMSNYTLNVKVLRQNKKAESENEHLDKKTSAKTRRFFSSNTDTGASDFIEVSSNDLVPGDIIELPNNNSIMPCDALILSGSAVINEALLTGESTPVFKVPIAKTPMYTFHERKNRASIVHTGTKLIQVRTGAKGKALALVLNTGFNTEKGNLVRSIIFPKDTEVKFRVDSIKIIFFMAFLAIIGYLVMLPFMIRDGVSMEEIMMRGIDLFIDTVPPSIPYCIAIGVYFSVLRLNEKGIKCISRERVSDIGKVDLICLDKTGTLTEEALEIEGYRRTAFKSNLFLFNHFQREIDSTTSESYNYYKDKIHGVYKEKVSKAKELKLLFTECIATCHNLTKVNNDLIGDPIDLEMFKSSGWELVETEEENSIIQSSVRPKEEKSLTDKLSECNPDDEDQIIKDHYEMVIIKRYDFTSKLQRMSVICKNPNEEVYKIFTKGSPEKIYDLCRNDTIPENFMEILNKYTSKGYRVLGLAGKPMKISYMNSNTIERDKLEKNMIFLGLLIIHNKLKETTIETITELQEANQKMLMATGDNILTAIAVSKACSLISKEVQIFTCKIEKNEKNKKYNILWEEIEKYNDKDDETEKKDDVISISKRKTDELDPDDVEDGSSISAEEIASELDDEEELRKMIQEKEEENKQLMLEELRFHLEEGPEFENIEVMFDPKKMTNFMEEDFIIAIQGSTFETIWKLRNNYVKFKNPKYKEYYNLFRLILQNTAIYARMAPDHKTILVESLKEENFIVLMCGDGANDCGALKAANVGVSLTSENSIASHFTSKKQDISCITEVLREGKCSLVTAISCFKAMVLYSYIQFLSVVYLVLVHSYLLDSQFLSADILIVPALQVLMAYTEPAPTLCEHQPVGDLFSFPVVASVTCHMIINILFQYLAYNLISTLPNFRAGGCIIKRDLDDPIPCDTNTVSNLK